MINSSMSMQHEVSNDALALLSTTSESNETLGNASLNGIPRLEMRTSISQPAYTQEPAILQIAFYNYGGGVIIPKLLIESDNCSEAFPQAFSNVSVGLSKVVSATVSSAHSGVCRMNISAFDENDSLITSFNGNPLKETVSFIVLNSIWENAMPYSITLNRQNENVAYTFDDEEDVYNTSAIVRGLNDANACACSPGNLIAHWKYEDHSGNGAKLEYRCICMYKHEQGFVSYLDSPEARFSLQINVSNQNDGIVSLNLSERATSSSMINASANISESPYPAINPMQGTIIFIREDGTISLEDLQKYDSLKIARNDFETRLALAIPSLCKYDCNGLITSSGLLAEKVSTFTGSSRNTTCSVNATHANCNTNLVYPEISLWLNNSFLGTGECVENEKHMISGIGFSVSHCDTR